MFYKSSTKVLPDRRTFLKHALGCTACATAAIHPLAVKAAPTINTEEMPTAREGEIRTLSLYNMHTARSLKIAYQIDGKNLQKNLTRLNFFLRDHRQNEATIMDARLFDQLWEIQQRLGLDTEFEIISGYRSPKTNAMLRANSKNVAQKSYHIRGRALDIRVYGASTKRLRNEARSLSAGGVGYYPRSRFVHIDTGPVRTWRS